MSAFWLVGFEYAVSTLKWKLSPRSPEGLPSRVYRACDVNSVSSQSSGSALNNILSKDFSKDNESTKLLLEADLQITSCKDLSKGGPIGCKEQIEVDSPEGQKQNLVLKSDLNLINIEFPPGVTEYTIRLIDEGVCAKLLSFKVACFVCESQIDNLVQFKERVAAPKCSGLFYIFFITYKNRKQNRFKSRESINGEF